MKVSLNWLTDYVDVSLSAKELAAGLARVGLGCEEIIETATDVVLDLEVTSNRPDCLGHLGVAREVAALTGATFRLPKIGKLKTSGKAAELTAVDVQAPDLCPRYTARVIRGVTVGESPSWMVDRLQAVGLRSINNVVDVTNYAMVELGHPMHAFDLGRLTGGQLRIRRPRPGERVRTLDGEERTLDPEMLVIADMTHAQAIAGVMGGAEAEVWGGTTAVAFESAYFAPRSVRRTSKRLGLKTEASARFERGADINAPVFALERACELLEQIGAGRRRGAVIDC